MDLEKAYDHVNWDFLLYMLRKCGFGGEKVLLETGIRWCWRRVSLSQKPFIRGKQILDPILMANECQIKI
jgi:hypothetical protein